MNWEKEDRDLNNLFRRFYFYLIEVLVNIIRKVYLGEMEKR